MAGKGSGWGGARIGAGRRPNSVEAGILSGALKAGDRPVARPIELIPAPAELRDAEKLFWDTWAPFACRARTLTPATVGEFRALCAMAVDCEALHAERRLAGWTKRGLALSREWRNLRVRVEVGRRAFQLAPVGKAMDDTSGTPGVLDPFVRFDTDESVQ